MTRMGAGGQDTDNFTRQTDSGEYTERVTYGLGDKKYVVTRRFAGEGDVKKIVADIAESRARREAGIVRK